MRKLATCLTLAAALTTASAALAADAERSFAVAFGGETPDLARRAEMRLPDWVAGLPDQLLAADGWDASRWGPLDVVARQAVFAVEIPTPGIARIRVRLSDDVGLRSVEESTEALAKVAVERLGRHVHELGQSLQTRQRTPLAQRHDDASRTLELTNAELLALESASGDPALEREMVAARLRTVASGLADARVDVVVTQRQLETARAAARRAAELSDLEQLVDRAEHELETQVAEADRPAAEAKFAILTAQLREAQAASPTLDVARDRVFSLEVVLVGLESRVAHLEGETETLRVRHRELLGVERRHRDLLARRDALRKRTDESAAALREQQIRFNVPVYEVVRPVGPVRDRGR